MVSEVAAGTRQKRVLSRASTCSNERVCSAAIQRVKTAQGERAPLEIAPPSAESNRPHGTGDRPRAAALAALNTEGFQPRWFGGTGGAMTVWDVAIWKRVHWF